MSTSVTQNTFLSVYNDDFRDSDHYHRILFNNGRALQARELTQMQTIIQSELAKLAGFILKEGGIFNTSYGAISAGDDALNYVKVNTLPAGYDLLVNATVSNSAGLTAVVKAVVPATGSDNNTLLVRYTDANNLTGALTNTPRTFNPGDTLSYDTGTISGTMLVQTTNTSGDPATGRGSFIEVPQFNTFVAGHLVMAEAQSMVIEKYNPNPTEVIGFKLVETIVSATDNIALYDNSGATPNLTSPGADRYVITLTISKQSDIVSGESFYPMYDIINGAAKAIQTRDNVLNELGTIVSTRTSDINGDFIVRQSPFGRFDLEIADDSDADYLRYRVSGGTAFVSGNRIEFPNTTSIRVAKPRSLVTDLDTKTNEFITARYGNYFLASENSIKGLVGPISTLAKINLYNKTNIASGSTVVGTARLRHLDKFEDAYRIHLFDVQMNSDGSGSKYSLATTRSVGTDSDNYANLTPIDGTYDLIDRSENSLLFPMPRDRVQEISNVTMAVRRVYTSTSNGSGSATFNTGTSNIFTDQENWIVSVDSSGQLFSPPTVSGTPNTATTITGLPSSSAVKLLGFETISATLKTKTLVANQTQSVSLTNREFKLSYVDIYKFTSVVDNTTGEDITYKFIFNNGQTDNFYTIGSGRLKNGVSAPAGSITVTFDYFSHTSGDYFGGKPSYPDIAYEDIPTHTTSNGILYRLSDVIDMRSVKNNTGTGFTGTGAVIENIPKNTGLITVGTVKYWQPRVDIVGLSSTASITVYNGDTALALVEPDVPENVMRLHKVTLNPYVVNTRDNVSEAYSNNGYKMRDIESLEKRIAVLEETATLTRAELDALQTTVPDPNDATLPDRVKNGLTSDGFNDDLQADVTNLDYRAKINVMYNAATPLTFIRAAGLYYDSDQSVGTVLKGGIVWPKYTEEVMIDQSSASKAINVNQFEVARTKGSGELVPDIDTWTVRKKVDNVSYKVDAKQSFVAASTAAVIESQGNQKGTRLTLAEILKTASTAAIKK